MRSIILLTATLLLATTCQKNEVGLGAEGSVKVNIAASGMRFTRAATTAENQISQMRVLVFKFNGSEYVFDYIADVLNIANGSPNSTNVSVELFTTPRATKLMVIANANNAVDAAQPIPPGETESSVRQRLTKGFTTTPLANNFPMWGELLFAQGLSTTMRTGAYDLTALRAVCRIDVNATTVGASFEMTSIQAYRANDLISLVPGNYTTNPLNVDAPTIPPGSLAVVNTLPLTVTGNLSAAQLYLSESAAPTDVRDATCVVVGGRYNNSPTVTYYRLDVAPPIEGYPLGQLLRNHHYQFNITSIDGPGWPTPDDAANNFSSNIESTVIDWTDIYNNININGTNFFYLPSSQVFLSGDINDEAFLDIFTDIQECEVFWSDAAGLPTDQYSGQSISNAYFAVTIEPTLIEIQTLRHNDLGNPLREQYFTVAAGRLRIPIKITQDVSENVHQSLWAQFNVDLPGTFAPTINSFGRLYAWNNSTAHPVTGTVANWPTSNSTSAVWESQNNPCPVGWRIPTLEEIDQFILDYPGRRNYFGTDPANPNQGTWFAPTQAAADDATFENPAGALFFPLAGTRNSGAPPTATNALAQYWSNARNAPTTVGTLFQVGGSMSRVNMVVNSGVMAISMRCIRDL